ncbi:DUF115 domain-containing protein [Opitutia bacterium ISCC 51]|nr:DUF115 domain-containing protein [Opitutae bacterium ISCC 51]QXD27000.1 DUF115 domain-containing protein [Opitutae bacterium ISCC 52]
MNVLVFTDSRGQHTAQGTEHLVFGDMLAKLDGLKVDGFYCPYKWTTTLDFLSSFDRDQLKAYDLIVLQTGIVDFSPRPFSNAVHDLYDCKTEENSENLSLNTRDYSRKVRNWKKPIFDRIFGEETMSEHFDAPFDSFYNGEKTINMYGLDMARLRLIPLLNDLPNLLYINTNRMAADWNGDYPRERPRNMPIIHDFSELYSKEIKQQVDLSSWTDREIKLYTTDNIHLTEEGNNFIFNRVLDHIDRKEDQVEEKCVTRYFPGFWKIDTPVSPFTPPEVITAEKRDKILQSYGLGEGPVASLVIGFRLKEGDPSRLDNMVCLLDWVNKYFPNLFEVILLEQDSEKRFDQSLLKHGERYEFIFNPDSYNRGWAYNVAVKHFVTTPVVATCDTDVLLGNSFLSSVLQCYKGKEFVSPYRNVVYTSEEEASDIRASLSLKKLNFDENSLKNPVSITGGIFIATCEAYERLAGYEQYMGYACEDRAFDATICELADPETVLIQNESYIHLWHPLDNVEKKNFDEIYQHLVANYGCKYHSELTYRSYIHQYCHHENAPKIRELVQFRRQSEEWGDACLYNKESLEINGLKPKPECVGSFPAVVDSKDTIYPDEFTNLDEYSAREEYADTREPSAELKHFYNKYKGERCVIIGNGPSLNNIDLGKIQSEYTFGVNSLYYKTRESGFMPTFFVVEDSSVMKENLAAIKKYRPQYKFFPTIYRNLHGDAHNTFFFKMNRGFYEKSSPNYCVPRFSTDFSKIAYCGQSVTHINLQLAFFMGFSEVYLVGMDFSYIIPESHSRKGDVLVSDTDDPNHFHKDYFGKGKSWKDPKLDRVLMNYKQAKLAYEGCGRKVYNATHGGKLEIFPRVNFDSVFRYQLPPAYSEVEPNTDPAVTAQNNNHESLVYLPNHGLVNLGENSFQFGLDHRIKAVRLRSLNTDVPMKSIDVDIETQQVNVNELMDFSGSEKQFLLDVMPEGENWISLGKLGQSRKHIFGKSAYQISGGFPCRSCQPNANHVAAVFRNGNKRIMLNLLTNNRSIEVQNNGHKLISPIQVGSLNVIGYNNG